MKTSPARAPSTGVASASGEPAVRVEGLRKVYRSRRREDVVAVDGISFSIGHGELVGLLGPNGAGKTTTIKCLCTLIRPTEGDITIDGADVVRRPRAGVQRVAAVLEGNRNIFWRLTVRENLDFFAALHGIPARSARPLRDELIARFDLQTKRDTVAQQLSRGMQQKLSVAAAFIKQTPVLLLDEPTLGLDVETSYELRAKLKEMASADGRTILLSSHDMDVVQEVCERVVIINHGRIVADERVADLLELFKVRAYRFDLEGSLADETRERLRNAFPEIRIEGDVHRTMLDVEFANGGDIYDLMEILRLAGAMVSSIDRRDPDLAEVFLKIVKGEA